MNTYDVIGEYKTKTRKRFLKVFVGLCICAVCLVADILTGSSWLSIPEVFTALFNSGEAKVTTRVIVWTLRLPAALMALGVGASLGLAGACMQTILDNSLASPYTLGISAGAGFGAALAILGGASFGGILGAYIVPVSAFSFSLLTGMIIYLLGKAIGISTQTMLLGGIGLSFLFQAGQSLLQYMSSPEALQSIVFWLFGSLSKSTWITAAIVYAVLFVILPLMLADTWKLTALKLGDEKARGIGVNVERLRVKMFVLISLLTSVAVCFVGVIGFIGLVGPHVARLLAGEDQRFFIPLSAIFGAAVLQSASVLSKLISGGAALPIGIVTALIGVPFYFSLIISNRKRFTV
jgi:iron complex transport system permease protein